MAVPLSLTGKYQLVVLGQDDDPQVRECAALLVNAVSVAFSQLGVNSRKFLVHSGPGNRHLGPGSADAYRGSVLWVHALAGISTYNTRSLILFWRTER